MSHGLKLNIDEIIERMRNGERLAWVPDEFTEVDNGIKGCRNLMLGRDKMDDEHTQFEIYKGEERNLIRQQEDDEFGVIVYELIAVE